MSFCLTSSKFILSSSQFKFFLSHTVPFCTMERKKCWDGGVDGMGWSSLVIGLLRAPMVLIMSNSDLEGKNIRIHIKRRNLYEGTEESTQ